MSYIQYHREIAYNSCHQCNTIVKLPKFPVIITIPSLNFRTQWLVVPPDILFCGVLNLKIWYQTMKLYKPVMLAKQSYVAERCACDVYKFIMADWGETFWVYVKELQHNVNDNIALQAFIKTTTLLNCPDFPSIFKTNTSIWLKMLDIGVHRYIAINIAILWNSSHSLKP